MNKKLVVVAALVFGAAGLMFANTVKAQDAAMNSDTGVTMNADNGAMMNAENADTGAAMNADAGATVNTENAAQ